MVELAGFLLALMLGGTLLAVVLAIIFIAYTEVTIKSQGWKNPYKRKGN